MPKKIQYRSPETSEGKHLELRSFSTNEFGLVNSGKDDALNAVLQTLWMFGYMQKKLNKFSSWPAVEDSRVESVYPLIVELKNLYLQIF